MALSGRSSSPPGTSSRMRSPSHPSANGAERARAPGVGVDDERRPARRSTAGGGRARRPCRGAASASIERWTSSARWGSRVRRPWCRFTATASTAGRTRSRARSTSGTLPTGQSAFGRSRVSGRRRVPRPAASTTPTMPSMRRHPRARLACGMIGAMTTTVDGIAGLKELVGQHLGYSDYMEITQERVNLFADATGDHQWIHVDVRAGQRREPLRRPDRPRLPHAVARPGARAAGRAGRRRQDGA